MRRMLAVLALVSLVACGGSDSSTGPKSNNNIAGSWRGSSGNVTMTLTLSQNGSTITGNGQMSGNIAVSLTASGTFVPPNVSMTLTAPGYEPFNYSGQLSGTVINGTMNGSGFQNAAFPLTKQ